MPKIPIKTTVLPHNTKVKRLPDLFLRIRSYPNDRRKYGSEMVDVWVIAKQGATEGSLMHGWITAERAELLARELAVPVEREERLYVPVRDSTGMPTGEVVFVA